MCVAEICTCYFNLVLSMKMSISSLGTAGFSFSCTLEHVKKLEVIVLFEEIRYSQTISKCTFFRLIINIYSEISM